MTVECSFSINRLLCLKRREAEKEGKMDIQKEQYQYLWRLIHELETELEGAMRELNNIKKELADKTSDNLIDRLKAEE